MSGFKGTPGPWSVIDGHYPSMKEVSGPSFKINIVMSATDLDFKGYLKRSADAHLIAAAPELLEALETLVEKVEYSAKIHPALDKAYDAIAKALGTESDQ